MEHLVYQSLTGQSFSPFRGQEEGRQEQMHSQSFLALFSWGINCICLTFAAEGYCLSYDKSCCFITEEFFEVSLVSVCQGDYTEVQPAEIDFRDQKSMWISTLLLVSGLDQYMLQLLFSILQLQHFSKLEPTKSEDIRFLST